MPLPASRRAACSEDCRVRWRERSPRRTARWGRAQPACRLAILLLSPPLLIVRHDGADALQDAAHHHQDRDHTEPEKGHGELLSSSSHRGGNRFPARCRLRRGRVDYTSRGRRYRRGRCEAEGGCVTPRSDGSCTRVASGWLSHLPVAQLSEMQLWWTARVPSRRRRAFRQRASGTGPLRGGQLKT